MNFRDLKVWTEQRVALGIEEESGRYYLSIPVSNRLADYVEYYEIERAAFDLYILDAASAVAFAESCRRREMDRLLMFSPGRDRGAP